VIREEHDGSITAIASSFQGRRLNCPSDVVVKSDGAIYFSDPNTGNAVPDYFELQKTPQEEEQQCRRSTTSQGDGEPSPVLG
jgi:gluconolactonase